MFHNLKSKHYILDLLNEFPCRVYPGSIYNRFTTYALKYACHEAQFGFLKKNAEKVKKNKIGVVFRRPTGVYSKQEYQKCKAFSLKTI